VASEQTTPHPALKEGLFQCNGTDCLNTNMGGLTDEWGWYVCFSRIRSGLLIDRLLLFPVVSTATREIPISMPLVVL